MAERKQDGESRHGGPSGRLHPGAREVFRDERLWVLDKPAGVLSHPNRAGQAPNVLFRAPYDAEDECFVFERDADAPPGSAERIWLVHRLDLETSGLILCAFDPETAARLKEALFEHEVEKEYHALLIGRMPSGQSIWEDRLERQQQKGRIDVRVRSGRPNAFTDVSLRREFPRAGLTLVSLHPRTGRTHQLRVQSASRRLPIAGDDRYGDFAANRFLRDQIGLKHMFLHAARLAFRHPSTGRRLEFYREPSRRLSEPLARLGELTEPVPRGRGGSRPSGPRPASKSPKKRGGGRSKRRGKP